MKKLLCVIILIGLIFSSSLSFGQKDSLKFTSNGISNANFSISHDDNFIYSKTLEWINKAYKNPDKVIAGKVEGSSITIAGYSSDCGSYHIFITIKNSNINYRMAIDEDLFVLMLFKKNGEVRGWNKEAKLYFDQWINKLYFSYYDSIIDISITSDEALLTLKKYKDKLDLQLITQDEYDKKKAELIKYIK